MELEHSFIVPVPKDQAWDVLLDVERVAPCMPGATLDSVDGDEIHGKIKVKVGPITMVYTGVARFVERDPVTGVVALEASGKETKGAGTASASVRSVLEDRGSETHVTVLTTLNVTGKPAQFGRGMMNEVGGKLLTMFAANLAATLAEPTAPVPAGTRAEPTTPVPAGARAETGATVAAPPAAAHAATTPPATPATPAPAVTPVTAATPAPAVTAISAATPTPVGATATGPAVPAADGTGGADGSIAPATASPAASLDAPISDLALTTRVRDALRRGGVTTIGELVSQTSENLLELNGIGPSSVEDIKAKLTERGLTLGHPPAPSVPAGATTGALTAPPTHDVIPSVPAHDAITPASVTADALTAPPAHDPIPSVPAHDAITPASVTADALTAPPAHDAITPGTAPATAVPPGPAQPTTLTTGNGARPGVTTTTQSRPGAAKTTGVEPEAINLLKVAAMPLLKRALPVLAGLTAALVIALRHRMRRRRRT